MANKMKVVDKFGAIKAMLNGEVVENFSIEDAVAFLDERIAITEKKNANGSGERKPTATQIANEGIKEQILSTLSADPMSIDNMQKENPSLSPLKNQKISALLTQLIKAGSVVRSEVKGKAHFALAPQE
jgi:hypothetical protein